MKYPVLDGHNDLIYNLHYPEISGKRDFFKRNPRGHLDLPRMKEGGFAGGFFAVYVPTEPQYRVPRDAEAAKVPGGYQYPMAHEVSYEYGRTEVLGMLDTLDKVVADAKGEVEVVKSAAQIEQCIKDDKLAIILHFEGAEAIGPDLAELDEYYGRGLRSLGIVWSRPNIFGHGVPFRFPHSPDTGPGLTGAGKELVKACNRLGIMLDMSHLNEQGFWDVVKLSDAPIVVTHTAAHAVSPSTRNITDKQLDAVKASNGMVGLNFNARDVRADGLAEADTPLEHYVKQMDYLVDRIGIDHVGFGSDFDGANISSHIGDATGLPKLIAALKEAGYDEPELNKITHENWIRVLRATWGS